MRIILTSCATVMLAPGLSAQQAPASDWPIAPDSRVRVLSPVLGKRFVTGSVISATQDTLVFRAASGSTSTAVPTRGIVQLEIARGTHTNTARGGFAGFVVGGLFGAMIAFATIHPACTNCLDYNQGVAALGGGLAAGAIGAVVGASIGRRPSDTWVPVAVPVR